MNLRGFIRWMNHEGPDDRKAAWAALPWVLATALVIGLPILWGGLAIIFWLIGWPS